MERSETTARPDAWSEDEVRRMLRSLRRPHTLGASPLARALARAYGVDDHLEAVKRFVNETFAGGGLVGRRLLELIVRSDFDGSLPLTSIAKEMGLSARQFFRYRQEAVRALQRRAQGISGSLGPSVDVIARVGAIVAQTDPVAADALFRMTDGADAISLIDLAINCGTVHDNALPREPGKRLLALCRVARGSLIYGDPHGGRRIVAWVRRLLPDAPLAERPRIEFELRWLEYIDTLYSASSPKLRELARVLPQLAGDDNDLLVRAYLSIVEAALSDGDVRAAQEAMTAVDSVSLPGDVRAMALMMCMRGALAFVQHDFALTDNFYSAASIVLAKRAIDRWNTQAFVGRARALLGYPWPNAPDCAAENLPGGTVTLGRCRTVALPPTTLRAHGRIMLKLVQLRAQIAAGPLDRIEREASESLELATSRGYQLVRAWAFAIRAQVYLAKGDLHAARDDVTQAWSAWAARGDRMAAIDLFAFHGDGALRCAAGNEPLIAAILQWIRERAPHHPFAAMSDGAARHCIEQIFAFSPDRPPVAPYWIDDPVSATLLMFFPPNQRASGASYIDAIVSGAAA